MPGRLRGTFFESVAITPVTTVEDLIAHRMHRKPQKVWIEWLTWAADTVITVNSVSTLDDINVGVTLTFAGTAPTYKIHAIV